MSMRTCKTGIRRYVQMLELAALSGGAGRTGGRSAPSGAVRSYYDISPDKLFRVMDDITRSDVARLYPLWLWAGVTGDWSHIESDWSRLKALVDQPRQQDGRGLPQRVPGRPDRLLPDAPDHMKDERSRQKGAARSLGGHARAAGIRIRAYPRRTHLRKCRFRGASSPAGGI